MLGNPSDWTMYYEELVAVAKRIAALFKDLGQESPLLKVVYAKGLAIT